MGGLSAVRRGNIASILPAAKTCDSFSSSIHLYLQISSLIRNVLGIADRNTVFLPLRFGQLDPIHAYRFMYRRNCTTFFCRGVLSFFAVLEWCTEWEG
jgi:hypothetical protein